MSQTDAGLTTMTPRSRNLHYIPDGQVALYRAAPELLAACQNALECLNHAVRENPVKNIMR